MTASFSASPTRSSVTEEVPQKQALGRARIVGILLGLAAAFVSFRNPISHSFLNVSALMVMVAVVVAVLGLPRGSINRLRVTAIDIIFLSYIAIRVFVEYLNATELEVPFGAGTILDLVIAYLALFACRLVSHSKDEFLEVLVGVALPGVAVAAIAVAQILGPVEVSNFLISHFSSGGLEARISSGWEIRGTSTIGHWTALGGYLSLVAAILSAKIVADYQAGVVNRRAWVALTIVVLGQVSTLTFATIAVTAAVVASTLYSIGIRLIHLLAGVGGVIASWVALGEMLSSRIDKQLYETSTDTTRYPYLPESVAFRVDVWVTESIPAITERPFIGWGIGTYRWFGTAASSDHLRWISPESEWIRTAVTAGVPALVVQLILIFLILQLLNRLRSVNEVKFIGPLFVAVAAILIASFIHSHLANRGVPLVLWPIVGAALGLALRGSQSVQNSEMGTKS